MASRRRMEDARQWVRILFFLLHLYNYIAKKGSSNTKNVPLLPFLVKRITGIEHLCKPGKTLSNECQMARTWSTGFKCIIKQMSYVIKLGARW